MIKQRERMCIACRLKRDKRLLKRVARRNDGEIFVDTTGKAEGRGAYVCSVECMAKCKKGRLLNRAFKCAVDEQIYDRLLKEFEEKGS